MKYTGNLITKAFFDRVCAIVLLLLLFPFLLVIGVFILVSMGRPVVFRQLRPGYKGKPFWLYKFRTMKELFDKSGKSLPDGERLTSLGKFLRITSLDELPEIFNVLKGEMSLVGPRPLLMEYLDLYTPEEFRRHDLKPGITGWAQINGRNAISWDDKFKLDLWYVDNWSFILDLRILFLTILKIIKRENINQFGQATAEKFKGKGK